MAGGFLAASEPALTSLRPAHPASAADAVAATMSNAVDRR
jgi:hypothetical protein